MGYDDFEDMTSTYEEIIDDCSAWSENARQYNDANTVEEAGDAELAGLLREHARLEARIAGHCRAVQAKRSNSAGEQLRSFMGVGQGVSTQDLKGIRLGTERTCSCGRTCDVGRACWWCGGVD